MDRTRWFAFTDPWDYISDPSAQTGKSILPNGRPNGKMDLPKQADLISDSKPDIERKRKRFTPPTIPEIEAKCLEIGLPKSEARDFFNHHAARGWELSRGVMMKSWTHALDTWKKNHLKFSRNGHGHSAPPAVVTDPAGWPEWLKDHTQYEHSLITNYQNTAFRNAPEFMKLEFRREAKSKAVRS